MHESRCDWGAQNSRQRQNVGVSSPTQRQTVAVLLFSPAGSLARPLALSGLVAARLMFARKHEVLLARDAPAPQERRYDHE
jgi:hypothetical protein